MNEHPRELCFFVIGIPHLVPATPSDQSVMAINKQTLSFVALTMKSDQFQSASDGVGPLPFVMLGNLIFGWQKKGLNLNFRILQFRRYPDSLLIVRRHQRMSDRIVGHYASSIDRKSNRFSTGRPAFQKAMEHECQMAFNSHDPGRIRG